MKQKILREYEKDRIIYLEYEKKIKELLKVLIEQRGLTIHAIESRVKDKESLSQKITRKENKYSTLSQITDTLGLRIITYFEDDVDKIANIIKNEFYVDDTNSVDKRIKNDPSTFGYLSLHYVINLKEPRVSLPEYSNFNKIKFEIQIRSILQHAWAEIEHDLGYKSSIEVPTEQVRDFSRIAGLLELADMEFTRMKKKIKTYSLKVNKDIKENKLNFPVDKITLEQFTNENSTFIELEEEIAKVMNAVRRRKMGIRVVERLEYLNITTISKLNSLLVNKKEKIVKFTEKWIVRNGNSDEIRTVSAGLSIFYLAYVLLAESEDEDKIYDYLKHFEIGERDERVKVTKDVIRIYNLIK